MARRVAGPEVRGKNAGVEERIWQRWTHWPLVAASVAFLVAYSWRVIAEPSGEFRAVTTIVIIVTWMMFIADYLLRLAIAPRRGHWFRTHLADLTFALVPVLRLVRLLRVLTLLPPLRRGAGAALRSRITIYGIGASVVLIYLAALAVLEVERYAQGADIRSFGEALWWACVTVTTTGFGDFVPVTIAGRFVGVGLMFGGVVLVGVSTAALASWILERAARGHDDDEPATRGQLRDVSRQLASISALLRQPDASTRSKQ